ncbi:MAG: amidohydrolase family protein [Deltaproteobacteria bacterium]|nr:amidohydrolase family protein [Deltaproteobacteria bacterium]
MLRIDNARWLREDGTWGTGTLLASAEGVRLLPSEASPPPCDRALDGRDALVLPGLLDPHVHLREPGQAYKEGITRGTRAALAGGVTTVLDMPNNRPPTSTEDRLEAKRGRFRRRARAHWGLHVQLTERPEPLDHSRVASAKLYMARSSTDDAVNAPARLQEIFRTCPRVTVHAEDEARFPGGGATHHERRPRDAVRSALDKIGEALEGLPAGTRPRVILCHVATVEELDWLQVMKTRGFDVWGETAPHYALYTQEDLLRLGSRLQVNPPLRTAADREAILEAIARGPIDFVGTDHAPHTPSEKASLQPPSGIAGIEGLGPWLVSLADQGLIAWPRLLDLGMRNAARCFGLPVVSGVAEGIPADLVLLRRGTSRRVVTRARWTPWCDRPPGWVVEATVVRGRLAWYKGSFPEDGPVEEVYP